MTKKTPPAPPVTAKNLKHIAGEGLTRPSALSAKDVRAISGALLARIEPRGKR